MAELRLTPEQALALRALYREFVQRASILFDTGAELQAAVLLGHVPHLDPELVECALAEWDAVLTQIRAIQAGAPGDPLELFETMDAAQRKLVAVRLVRRGPVPAQNDGTRTEHAARTLARVS